MKKKKYKKYLDPNKAHGYNMISISIMKRCKSSIRKLLELPLDPFTVANFLLTGKGGKKVNVVPVHKKVNK